MSTTKWDYSRGDEVGEIAQSSAGAIAGDVTLILEDTLTREEIVLGLEKIRGRILETNWPPT